MPRWITALLAAALMATGTTAAAVAPVAPAAIGTVEDLGEPITNFLILDSVVGADRDGRPTLYGSTYAASSPGVAFFAIDVETGELVKELPMPDSWGGYHTSLGSDGRVYLATQHGDGLAHLWRYDPATEELSIVATTDETDIGHTFFFGVGAGRGTTYLGTYPSGKLFAYDQSTSALTDLGTVQQDRLYAKAIVPLDGRRVFVGGGTPASANIVDTRTGVATSILPPEYAGYSFAYNAAVVGTNLLVQLVVPDQRVLRFELRGTRTVFAGEVPGLTGTGIVPISGHEAYAVGSCPDSAYGIVRHDFRTGGCEWQTDASWVSGQVSRAVLDDGSEWLVGVGSKGLLGRYNPETGEVVTSQLTFSGSGSNVTALRTGPDGAIYGGTYETNALFRIDPDSGATTVLGGVAAGRSGEILSLASTDDELYMGSYTHNVVTVYDPARPWAPGTDPGASNPLDLGPVGEEQYRPWDMVQGSSGDVFLASGAAYGQLGGALSRIDPDTHSVSSWRGLAGDQNLFALAAGDGEIYAGSTTHGDGVTASGDAQLLVFDESSSTVVHAVVPVPGSTWIASLAVAGNGQVYGSTLDGQWFRFDPSSRQVTRLGAFPLGSVNALATGPDGLVYGTGGVLFRIDPATDAVTTLADVGGGYYRTIAFDDEGRVYWGSGTKVMRWTP